MQKTVILGMSRDHFRPRTARGLKISKIFVSDNPHQLRASFSK